MAMTVIDLSVRSLHTELSFTLRSVVRKSTLHHDGDITCTENGEIGQSPYNPVVLNCEFETL